MLIGLGLTVGIGACSDLPPPNGQGGVGAESRSLIKPIDPPESVVIGVVPDVLRVEAFQAAAVVSEAGFAPRLDPLQLEFTKGGRVSAADVICRIEPEAGSTPMTNTTVTLVYDDKCANIFES